jgi:quinol monooxygenase YgiN
MLRVLALAAIAMTAVAPTTASAQDASFYTVTYVEVGPILSKVGAAALKAYRDPSRKDPGNVHLDIFENMDRPNQFVILGAWKDKDAFEAHKGSAHFKTLGEKLLPILVAPTDTRHHIALSGSTAVAPDKSAKDAIIAVTHVDVIPPQKDNGIAALKQLADESRKHPGNLQFHVWQQVDRPNHATVVEAWNNRGAFNVHQMRQETRDFRTKLAPMSGALYDERLFKPLK